MKGRHKLGHKKGVVQVEITLKLKCECGIEKDIPIINIHKSTGNTFDLTESIEQNSDGLFYCLQNRPYAFELVCGSCGKEKSIFY